MIAKLLSPARENRSPRRPGIETSAFLRGRSLRNGSQFDRQSGKRSAFVPRENRGPLFRIML